MDRPRRSRRAVLAGVASGCAVLAGCPGDDALSGDTDGRATTTRQPTQTEAIQSVGTTRLASGLTSPVSIVAPDTDRLLVGDQPGRLVRVADGETTAVLDIGDRLVNVTGYDERGLLGLALHPTFGQNGLLYVRYSAPRRRGTPQSFDHTFVLSEFTMDPGSLTVDADSERTILEIPQPQPNHNAGDIAFGPDGYLYVPVGDGGGSNDRGQGHVEDWYAPVPGGNGQDVDENLLGSILRIDVDDPSTDRGYGIPGDNPLVDEDGLDEHYAWGFRNPWRLSFGPDGRLFVGDVGQSQFEEVDVVDSGGNYGWNVREGGACFRADDCPTVTPDGQRLRGPILTYPHAGAPVSGIAIVGGYLYDGDGLSGLQNQYIFGDWQANGRLFVARPPGTGTESTTDAAASWSSRTLPFADDAPGQYLLSFGREPTGELLVGTTNRGVVGGQTGAVFRLTPP